MKAIQVTLLGVRNCRPPSIIPVPQGMDAYVFMALFLEERMSDGCKVIGSYKNADTYGVKQPGATGGVLKVELIDIEAVEAKAS
jgi:hypothetical protein